MNTAGLKPHPHPRRIGEHVVAIVNLIEKSGGEDVRVYQLDHVLIEFKVGRTSIQVRTSCTPRNSGDEAQQARQKIMRQIERALGRRG